MFNLRVHVKSLIIFIKSVLSYDLRYYIFSTRYKGPALRYGCLLLIRFPFVGVMVFEMS
jgi:hypothetical protein